MALETLTLASYVCAGYERQNRHSSYASVQYFILGSIPSGMLILGLGLLYSQSGVLNFEDLDLVCYNNLSFESNSYQTLIHGEFNLSGESWRTISGLFEYFNNLSSHLTDSKNFTALNN
jgi:NADH:ubiquinone oxidoreductase subunit 5 (subunit L)/multisubunit Na+/H+ antiporter MnhA subunit